VGVQYQKKLRTPRRGFLNSVFHGISIVKVTLNNKENKPLVIIPGYSNKSFESGFDKLMGEFESYKDKYSVMYAVCWGSTV
jgi:hypothetical protein